MERVLVTGGAGFIGSHTVELLLQQNKQVTVLDNLSSGCLTNLDLSNPNLEFIEGDVLEFPLLQDLIGNADAVLHLAAIASVPASLKEPIYSFQVNTQGFLHVLEAVKLQKRAMRVVYASSAAVYGNVAELPCSDSSPFVSEAISPYALQKRHDEDYALLYARLHNVRSVGLRYFNVYGVRQPFDSPYSGVVSRFINAYQQNKPLLVYGDGKQSRDFIYVTDVARANCLALASDCHGVFNVATGSPETLLQVIEYIEENAQKPAGVTFKEARKGDILTSYACVKQAQRALAFQSTVPMRKGTSFLLGIPKST